MDFPGDLKYTKEHEWLRYDATTGEAVVGITSFAQSELGDIVFVEFEPTGVPIESDAIFGTVEAVKTVSELFAPVAGSVLEVNQKLEANPELVNEDPYGEGWMIRMKVDSADEVAALLSAEDYAAMVR
jgi:glycine cleavage system H protein